MPYRLLADAVVVLHLGFVAFVLLGGLLTFRWPRLAWLHLPAAAWGAATELGGILCPLTPLEIWLRRRGGLSGYEGDFVEHYLVPLLYPQALTRSHQIILGTIVVVLNLLVYTFAWYRRRR